MVTSKGPINAPLALVAAALLITLIPAEAGVAQTAIETQRVTFAAGTDLLQEQILVCSKASSRARSRLLTTLHLIAIHLFC